MYNTALKNNETIRTIWSEEQKGFICSGLSFFTQKLFLNFFFYLQKKVQMFWCVYLQVIVSHHTQEGDDGVQDGQEAECGGHVASALLEDEVL